MAMNSCKNKCLCSKCKKIKVNCAECKYSVIKTKECLKLGIKACKYFEEEIENECCIADTEIIIEFLQELLEENK